MADNNSTFIKPNIKLNNIIKNINSSDEKNVTIYVAIGSSAEPALIHDINNNTWSIPPEREQQFPPFLRTLKQSFPFDPLHIILVDPNLENPPFIICNSNRIIGDDWNFTVVDNIPTYHNDITNITVYCVSNNVEYFSKNCINDNIYDFFENLNELAIKNNWLVIVQDYCGNNIDHLNSYFGENLDNHKNHIVYGIGVGFDGGCFINLTLPLCNFVFEHDGDGIKVFNPYYYNDATILVNIVESLKFEGDSYEIVKNQSYLFIDKHRKFIHAKLLTLLRHIYILKSDYTDHNISIDSTDNIVIDNYISKKYNIHIVKMFIEKKYEEAFEKLLIVITNELIIFFKSIHNDNAEKFVNDVIKEILNETDFYKWGTILKNKFDEYYNVLGWGCSIPIY